VASSETARTVLIVDDDQPSRDAVAAWFREAGWHVRLTCRCADAVPAATLEPPDHLIVEQRLADGSGLDLLHRLRRVSPRLDAVVLTRYPSIAGAVHAIRLGFRDYLSKPIDWTHLARLFNLRPPGQVSEPANDTQQDACTLARIEWEHIQAVLFTCRGNISAAARRLGVHRRSLQRKLRRFAPM
jgi:two-component system response regulator RegA